MLPVGMVWTDEDEQVYVVAPADSSVLGLKRRMLRHCREFLATGDTVALEGAPKLSYLREPEGDEDEERLFDVEPDDPRANSVWIAGYFVSFAPRSPAALGDSHETAGSTDA